MTRDNYLFVVAPITLNHAAIGSLILGSPIDPTGQMDRLLLTLVFGNIATLAIALAGGYWLADRAMRPVRMITRAAREISETDLSHRLNLGARDELGELADTFDGMLSRLQAAFSRQRQFTADASHELRTPLTIINLETGRALAARRTRQEYERALTVIQSENE
jgi:signal transduction histidine kinase